MGDRWIFGYGSLVWRPAFPFRTRVPGFVRGYTRRFWQGSTDHRGIVGAPGRVVTVLPEPSARVWGMLYQVDRADVDEVLARLDHREKGGYERHEVEVQVPEHERAVGGALMYAATPKNPEYLGEAPLPEIAAQVRRSHGPSGANLEYVLRLAEALREIGADDEHVFALAELLRGDER